MKKNSLIKIGFLLFTFLVFILKLNERKDEKLIIELQKEFELNEVLLNDIINWLQNHPEDTPYIIDRDVKDGYKVTIYPPHSKLYYMPDSIIEEKIQKLATTKLLSRIISVKKKTIVFFTNATSSSSDNLRLVYMRDSLSGWYTKLNLYKNKKYPDDGEVWLYQISPKWFIYSATGDKWKYWAWLVLSIGVIIYLKIRKLI